jgi:hypothetical protein
VDARGFGSVARGLARLGQLVCWLADPGDGLIDLSPRVMNSMYVYIYKDRERES